MASDLRVPVQERAESEQLRALLRSDAVQELMAGRVDAVRIVNVRCYKAKCFAPDGPFGFCWAHLNATSEFEDSEWVVAIGHELAHLSVGIAHQHDSHFRGAWCEMVGEAGELGLLTDEQVLQATRQILFGPASVFRGWPENARKREEERQRLLAAARDKRREMGVKPGVEILYRYRQHARRAEVIRVNKRTVSVGRPGSGEVLRRVRIERVIGVCGC